MTESTTIVPSALPTSVFEELSRKVYSLRYRVQLTVGTLVGGVPTDQNVAEGWIRTKLGAQLNEDQIRAEVEKVMDERGVKPDAAIEEVAKNRSLSGFKRDFTTTVARNMQRLASTRGVDVKDKNGNSTHKVFAEGEAAQTFGELFIEGRQIKAMIKEAAMIAVGGGHINPKGWGTTRKSMLNFLVEHLFVADDRVYLGVTDPDEVVQSFVHTWRGSGIKLEERLHNAVVDFTLCADWDFDAAKGPEGLPFFGTVMVVAQQNGLGASRSQGFGKFSVTRWEQIDGNSKKKPPVT